MVQTRGGNSSERSGEHGRGSSDQIASQLDAIEAILKIIDSVKEDVATLAQMLGHEQTEEKTRNQPINGGFDVRNREENEMSTRSATRISYAPFSYSRTKEKKHNDDLAALETWKPYEQAAETKETIFAHLSRYYVGWADKVHGLTVPADGRYEVQILHEPIGVAGQIIPWNFPLLMFAWEVGPALACGNTIVLKSIEQTPLTALYVAAFSPPSPYPTPPWIVFIDFDLRTSRFSTGEVVIRTCGRYIHVEERVQVLKERVQVLKLAPDCNWVQM